MDPITAWVFFSWMIKKIHDIAPALPVYMTQEEYDRLSGKKLALPKKSLVLNSREVR